MKIELETSPTLSLERKIKMHEAREAIIDRLARDLPTNIDLERFLRVVVSELGRMMQADRCDLLQLTRRQRTSHQPRMAGFGRCSCHRKARRFRLMRKNSPNISMFPNRFASTTLRKRKTRRLDFLPKHWKHARF